MRFYAPLAKVDAAQQMVWGYASTEAEDDQGETVTRDALAAALADYLKFANIREMHQMSAVGVAEEAAVDDKGLYVGARIVDPRAWDKVTSGVYKGFSIGGRVKSRDPADRSVITGLSLTEISLVDRPANPEAVFDCWKAEGGHPMADAAAAEHQPVQIWHCGIAAHRHLAKTEAARCLERRGGGGDDEAGDYADPGYQPDGAKRYPLDSESHVRAAWAYIHQPGNADRYTEAQLAHIKARIVAAWQEKIDPADRRPPESAARPRLPTHCAKDRRDQPHRADHRRPRMAVRGLAPAGARRRRRRQGRARRGPSQGTCRRDRAAARCARQTRRGHRRDAAAAADGGARAVEARGWRRAWARRRYRHRLVADERRRNARWR